MEPFTLKREKSDCLLLTEAAEQTMEIMRSDLEEN